MKRVLHFSEEMAKKGYTYSTNMLSNELVPASRTIAKALQIEEGCPLVRVTRLRYANGVPMCMEIAHLVYERCPGVYGTDFSQTSLRNFLSEEYNIVWSSARQRIYAINASTKIAGHLDVKEHGALIYIERVSCPADGKPGEYLEGYYRGDSYYLTTELQA